MVFPLLLVFGSWWAPRWVLPGWVKERLDAGDSARSAFPAAELVPLMRYEQNRPDLVLLPTEEQLELPTRLPVNRVRWGISAVVVFGLGVFCVFAVAGVVPMDDGPFAVMLLAVLPVAAVVLLLAGAYHVWGFVRPLDVVVAEEGVATRDWVLGWGEIQAVVQSRTKLGLAVSEEAFERVRGVNRWHSGRPLGLGGLLPVGGVVGLQALLRDEVRAGALLQQVLWVKTGRGSDPRDEVLGRLTR